MIATKLGAEGRTAPPPLFERQRQLVALLDALGGEVGNLDFQKLLFLYCQEPASAGAYDFVPYKSGAFSFTSYADRRKLIERGYLADIESQWRLTEQGKRAAGGAVGLRMKAFVRRYIHLRGDDLVAETYRRFPYYAIKSEIAERVLRGDEATLTTIQRARPSSDAPVILSTIGYEGRTFESYLNEVINAGVTLLCDVRRNPISRKYGFSKGTLARGCGHVGLQYEHLPELGIASQERRNLETQADYDALFQEYIRETLPVQGEVLRKIHDWIQSGERVALTCYERLPEQCHRHCVADALERRYGARFAPKHL